VKPIKMLGLAMLATLMAMSFVGAGSAMAETTSLCEEDETPCAEENIITHVHEATLPGHKAILLSSLTVECDVLFLGDTRPSSASPLIIDGAFTYENCTNKCEVKEENGPAQIKVLREGQELAKVTSGTGGAAGLVHVNCPGFINCRYTGSGLVGHGLGALTSSETNGAIALSEQEVAKESGSLCPSTGKLDITTTPLEPLHLASSATSSPPLESTALCDADPGAGPEEVCPPDHVVTHVHEATLSGHKGNLLSSIEVECDVLFLGDALSTGLASPLVIHGSFTYSNCEGGCTATEENSPAEINVEKRAHETADVTSGAGAGAGLVHLTCGGFINCRYTGEGLLGTAKGPLLSKETNGEVSLQEKAVKKESGTFCPNEANLDIVTTPLEETYITH
jgi:hypothetical protein